MGQCWTMVLHVTLQKVNTWVFAISSLLLVDDGIAVDTLRILALTSPLPKLLCLGMSGHYWSLVRWYETGER